MTMRFWLTIPLSMFVLSTAQAEPLSLDTTRDEEPTRSLLARELPERDTLQPEEVAESRDWRRLHLRKGAGLEVRRSLTVGDREVVLGVKGPLMKKKRLGVAFEVRF